MPKMPAAIVAMLGVLKADAIYVPMDPASPRGAAGTGAGDQRLPLHSGRRGPGRTGSARNPWRLRTLQQRPIIGWLDEDLPPPTDPAPAFFPARPLAAFFGDQPRQPPTAATTWRTSFSRREIHRIAQGRDDQPRPPSYISSRGHGPTLASSARTGPPSIPPFAIRCVHFRHLRHTLVRRRIAPRGPAELNSSARTSSRNSFRDARLTQWFSVPSVLNMMANLSMSCSRTTFPDLRRGPVRRRSDTDAHGDPLDAPASPPRAFLPIWYGPTETTIVSSYYKRCPRWPGRRARARFPSESRATARKLLVLDEQLQPVVPGRIGDLLYPRSRPEARATGAIRKRRIAYSSPYPRRNRPPATGFYRTGDLARLARTDGPVSISWGRGRHADQEPRLPHRTGRDRGGRCTRFPTCGKVQCWRSSPKASKGWLICCAYVAANRAKKHFRGEPAQSKLARLVPGYMIPRAAGCAWDGPAQERQTEKLTVPLLRNQFSQYRSPPGRNPDAGSAVARARPRHGSHDQPGVRNGIEKRNSK